MRTQVENPDYRFTDSTGRKVRVRNNTCGVASSVYRPLLILDEPKPRVSAGAFIRANWGWPATLIGAFAGAFGVVFAPSITAVVFLCLLPLLFRNRVYNWVMDIRPAGKGRR
jgi:hypothetical protein